ncbi:MAG: knotted carbamoyltransferase YgeW [Acidobacteria bacterium]|nr:knotted carbamoyltransferase YgeW [Acidobacteriota bacterium]MCB9377793.1 knotted carbamoyltransferase YgeW [Holophagales bacterium]
MSQRELLDEIDRLRALAPGLNDRDFLLTWRESEETLRFVLGAAAALEGIHRAGLSARVFDAGLGIAIFRDKSTRTRYSFKSACNLLGLGTEELEESTSQIAHGETVRETAAMIGFLSEVVGIRDDMYLGEGHAYMAEVAASLDEAHREGVLAQRPAVVNLQCDLDHPTQSLADLSHLVRLYGGLENLRGKKLAMTWAHSPSYGKPLSVPQGIVALMTRFGMEVVLAHPEGYELVDEPLEAARRFAAESGGSFRVTHSMEEAFANADVVYPKSWAPMAVMRERPGLLRAGDKAGLAELERAALAANARHRDWECDATRMELTRGGAAHYLHCLPADVTEVSCVAGEVSKAVFERARLDTYREASHKPFVIAAMILATRVPDPATALARIVQRAHPRRFE